MQKFDVLKRRQERKLKRAYENKTLIGNEAKEREKKKRKKKKK